MEAAKKRRLSRIKKKKRVRKKVNGNAERPRVNVFRSSKHLYVQVINDDLGKTLISCSTLDKEIKEKISGYTGNRQAARIIGQLAGERLKAKGISTVVFDRNGFLYHGRVKELAEGMRESGLIF